MGENNSGPFKSLREYLEAVKEHKLAIQIENIDQDKYEATALIYKLIEKYGVAKAPVVGANANCCGSLEGLVAVV